MRRQLRQLDEARLLRRLRSVYVRCSRRTGFLPRPNDTLAIAVERGLYSARVGAFEERWIILDYALIRKLA